MLGAKHVSNLDSIKTYNSILCMMLFQATKEAGRIFPSHTLLAAAAPLIKYEINVTNTGTMDAEDVSAH